MEYETSESRHYDDENRDYDRDRSRSPREERSGDADTRVRSRSASPNGRSGNDGRGPMRNKGGNEGDDGAVNPGSNLFVTGIHPKLSEEEVTRLFEKYGTVEKCQIMRDPHTNDSRGFGFVKMVTPEEADAAKDGLQGQVHEGRTLSIEKARRAKPRTPTPGKYYGPPKRDDVRGARRGGGGRFGGRDGYDDRRGGYGGRRDDYYSGGGGGYRSRNYEDRYRDERSGGRRERDGYGGRGTDSYSGGYDDRYASRGEERRGYDRPPRGQGGYGDGPPGDRDREGFGSGNRGYDDRGEYRDSRR